MSMHEVFEWFTAERLQTLALIGAICLCWLVYQHERAHCRQIGALQDRVEELSRRLGVDDQAGGDR